MLRRRNEAAKLSRSHKKHADVVVDQAGAAEHAVHPGDRGCHPLAISWLKLRAPSWRPASDSSCVALAEVGITHMPMFVLDQAGAAEHAVTEAVIQSPMLWLNAPAPWNTYNIS
jgi:hypothetical protein